MKEEKVNPCIFCWYARMREDICGIYCTGGFREEDGKCRRFVPAEDWQKSGMEDGNGNGWETKQDETEPPNLPV